MYEVIKPDPLAPAPDQTRGDSKGDNGNTLIQPERMRIREQGLHPDSQVLGYNTTGNSRGKKVGMTESRDGVIVYNMIMK